LKIIRQSILLLALVVLTLNLAGCTTVQPTTATMTERPPTDGKTTWQGSVLEVDAGGESFLASVDADFQKLLGDKAHVDFYKNAKIVLNLSDAPIDMSAVPIGSWVIVTITGGIRESYPVQVSATEVRVTLVK